MDNTTSDNFSRTLKFCFKMTILILAIFFVYSILKGKPSGLIVLLGLLFLYLFYYFSSRSYLDEGFQVRPLETIVKENDVILDTANAPYLNKPINSVDDYEYNLVFDNENDREITKELRNKLMSQYPMDWSTQPTSSAFFTKGQKESFENSMPIDLSQNELVYKNVSGSNLQPPDMDAIEEKERKILQTYHPKNTGDLKTYDINDAYKLINKIYNAKGEIPTVEHTKDTNIYTIVGTRNKNEKIEYEDDLPVANIEDQSGNGENTIVVPQAAKDLLMDSDPFYNAEKTEMTHTGKWDYTKWTPGLERSMAPTYPLSQWY
jgi:Ca2+/Na+ antiporter